MTRKAMCAVPPMGWNSWNTFTDKISEDLIKETVDAMKDQGFLEAGYEYVVMDDCWSLKERDDAGRLVADPEKFPHGIKALSDYVHDKGFKFGMYSCCGTRTCANYPGSFEHEYEDARRIYSEAEKIVHKNKCARWCTAGARGVYKTGRSANLPTPALPGSGWRVLRASGSQPFGAPVFMSNVKYKHGGQNVKPPRRKGSFLGRDAL